MELIHLQIVSELYIIRRRSPTSKNGSIESCVVRYFKKAHICREFVTRFDVKNITRDNFCGEEGNLCTVSENQAVIREHCGDRGHDPG